MIDEAEESLAVSLDLTHRRSEARERVRLIETGQSFGKDPTSSGRPREARA